MKKYKIGNRYIRSKDHLISDVVGTVKDITGEVSKAIKTDAVLIRTRDKIFNYFKQFGLGPGSPSLDAAAAKNKIGHKDIPNRKVGGNYNAEWARLYQFVIDVFNNAGRDDLAELFERTVPVFTETAHDPSYVLDLLKGKIRAVPQAIEPQDIAADIAYRDISETERKQRATDLAPQRPNAGGKERALIPFVPLMKKSVRTAGYVPERNLDALAVQFYNTVVKTSTQGFDADFLDEAIVDSILYFIATLQEKHAQGEQLPPIYQKIAEGADRLTQQGETVVRRTAEAKAGAFVLDNSMLIMGGLAILVIVALTKK